MNNDETANHIITNSFNLGKDALSASIVMLGIARAAESRTRLRGKIKALGYVGGIIVVEMEDEGSVIYLANALGLSGESSPRGSRKVPRFGEIEGFQIGIRPPLESNTNEE